MPVATAASETITVTCIQRDRNRPDRRFRLQAIQNIEKLTRHSFAGALARVLQVLADRDSNHDKIAGAISKDLHFRLAIQHVAGSAFYRPRNLRTEDGPIDLTACMRILGREAVAYLALRQGILRLSPRAGEMAAPLVAHLFVTAEIARQLGRERGQKAGDRAYLAGLMHDFGKLALLQAEPEIYEQIAALCRRESLATRDAEREMLATDIVEHADHAYFGAKLLELAHVDAETVDAVRGHHDPLPDADPDSPHLSLHEIVQIANLLANRAGWGDGFAHRPTGASEDPTILSRLSLDPERQDEMVRLAVRKAAEAIDAVTDPRADRQQREWNEQVRRLLQAGAAGAAEETGEPEGAPADTWLAMLDFLADREKASLVRLLDFTGKGEDELRRVLDLLTDGGYLEHARDRDDVPIWIATPLLGRAPLQRVLADLEGGTQDRGPEPPEPEFLTRRAGAEFIPLSIPDGDWVDTAWSPDGSRLALRRRNGEIVQWLIDENRETARIPAIGSRITSMTWAADSRTLMMGTEFGEILVVPGGRWARSQRIDSGPTAILACALSSANDLLATGAKDGGVRLWRRSREGVQEVELGRHCALVNDVAWSRDGELLASASADGTARIWNPSDGAMVDILAGQSAAVRRVAWSPDSRLLVVGLSDGTVRVWDVEGRNYTVRLEPGGGPISRLGFSADGTLLAAQDQQGAATFWHTADWRSLGRRAPAADTPSGRHQEGLLTFHPWSNRVLVDNGAGQPSCLQWFVETLAAMIEKATNGEWSVQPKWVGPRGDDPDDALTLVHMSDLHFRARDDVGPRVDHLLNDLLVQVGVPKVDFVLISGDLVDQAARKEEYGTARWFIEGVRQQLQLDRDRILIVPGNHDVDWSDRVCQCEDYTECPKIQAGESCRCLDGPPGAEACAEAYRLRFENFSRELYGTVQDAPYNLDYGEQVMDRSFPEAGVRFIGWNTAWHTDRNQPQEIDVNADAQTTLVRNQTHWQDGGLLNIGLLHHPVHYGQESVPADFLRHLQNLDVRLTLNGHIHQGEAEYTGVFRPNGTVLLATGSFDAESGDLPEGVLQEYQVLQLSVDRRLALVHSRHKKPSARDWEANHRWEDPEGAKHARMRLSIG